MMAGTVILTHNHREAANTGIGITTAGQQVSQHPAAGWQHLLFWPAPGALVGGSPCPWLDPGSSSGQGAWLSSSQASHGGASRQGVWPPFPQTTPGEKPAATFSPELPLLPTPCLQPLFNLPPDSCTPPNLSPPSLSPPHSQAPDLTPAFPTPPASCPEGPGQWQISLLVLYKGSTGFFNQTASLASRFLQV